MAQQVLGRVTVRLNGQELLTKVGAELTGIGGVSRKTIKGDKVHGYAEMVEEPEVNCVISVNASTDLDSLAAMTDGTVLYQFDTGQSYVIPHAWQAAKVGLKSGDGGDVSLKFAGVSAQRVT